MPADADAELAALAGRALNLHASHATPSQLRAHGRTADDAILLDDDIDQSTPQVPRSERPRVGSILRGRVPRKQILDMLSARGAILKAAAPDGNCAPRSACCSAGKLSHSSAISSDGATMQKLSAQRARVVDRVSRDDDALPADAGGPSVSMREMRAHLRVSSAAMEPFRRLGHWNDGDSAFILFLWGLADDLQRPIAVLHKEADGTYVDPLCVYRPQSPSGQRLRDNSGAFSYTSIAELMAWIDGSAAWPPPFALVEFVPGHYSPFLFAGSRPVS